MLWLRSLSLPPLSEATLGRASRLGDYHILDGVYEIIEPIGSGETTDVYLGQDLRAAGGPSADGLVTISCLQTRLAGSPAIARRFLEVARGAESLTLPGAAPVLDAGRDADTYYAVTGYAPGKTLARILEERGPLPVDEAVAYARQVLRTLEAAHQASIVFGNIGPHSVVVGPDGATTVLGFGAAGRPAAGGPAPDGASNGQPTADLAEPRADLRALSATLFELLAGAPPPGSGANGRAPGSPPDAPPAVRALRPDAPLELEQVIARGLGAAPARPYANAGEMLDGLDRAMLLAGDGAAAPTTGDGLRPRRRSIVAEPHLPEEGHGARLRLPPWVASLGAVLGLVGVAAAIVIVLGAIATAQTPQGVVVTPSETAANPAAPTAVPTPAGVLARFVAQVAPNPPPATATASPTGPRPAAAGSPTATARPLAATPASGATPATPTAATGDPEAEAWKTTLGQVNAVWGKDWPKAITLLDAFHAAHPKHAEATARLYAALVADSQRLLQAGRTSEASAQLTRAKALGYIPPSA